ncbi:MAG: hypothetical protein EBR82_59405 [Caulobacteraceae bacterium]|nr:hypothetical protein [Caulobacteraceae bacterium]
MGEAGFGHGLGRGPVRELHGEVEDVDPQAPVGGGKVGHHRSPRAFGLTSAHRGIPHPGMGVAAPAVHGLS